VAATKVLILDSMSFSSHAVCAIWPRRILRLWGLEPPAATMASWRVALEFRGVGAISINVRRRTPFEASPFTCVMPTASSGAASPSSATLTASVRAVSPNADRTLGGQQTALARTARRPPTRRLPPLLFPGECGARAWLFARQPRS